jgi:general secretion pathway protein L
MPEKILGLDIGESSVKAVQVTAGLKGYHIVNTAVIDIAGAGGAEEAVTRLFEDESFKSGVCIISLPVKNLYFRNMRLPFKDKKKIGQTLSYELEPHIPYPVDSVVADFIIVDQSDQSDILAAAVLKTTIRDILNLLEKYKMEAAAIDVDGAPVASKVAIRDETGGYGLLLDIGARDTACVIFGRGRIFHVRHFLFGGNNLTEAVAKTLDIGFDDAEERKKAGIVTEAGPEVSKVCRKFLDDVKSTVRFLQLRGDIDAGPEKIYLTGGGSAYPACGDEIQSYFSLPVVEADLSKTDDIEFEGKTGKDWNPALMNQALALATRDAKKGEGFNFGLGEFEPKGKYEKFRQDFKWIASLVAVILVVFGVDLYLDYHFNRSYVNRLEAQIISVFKNTCPDVTKIVDPVQQLKVKIEEARKSALGMSAAGSKITVLEILKDISRLVPDSVDFLITSFAFDGKALEIKGETDNFNSVDTIKKYLVTSNYFTNVNISSASIARKGSRVGFDLRMELK